MGVVRLHRIISFSCQDAKHPVKNLLCNNGPKPSGCWLSSPYDKSGRIEAEFQLENPSFIHFIDIGNCGSSSVEILVRCSSWPKSRGYVHLLPAVQMMSSSEFKSGINMNAVRMFTTDHMDKEAIKEKWDRVKVICNQSYCRDKQFGLSFLRFSGKEANELPNGTQSPEKVHFEFTNMLKKPVPVRNRLLSPSTRNSKFSPKMSRARVLLKAAQKKQATLASKTPTKRALFTDEETNSELETDFLCFVTAMLPSPLQFSYLTADACMQEYEEIRDRNLTVEEKETFRRVFSSVFPQDDESSLAPAASSPVTPKQFYSSPKQNGVKENGHHEEDTSAKNVYNNDISFDISDVNFKHPDQVSRQSNLGGNASVSKTGHSSTPKTPASDNPDLSPEKRPKRKKKYITMKDMSRSPIKQRRVVASPKQATPKQGAPFPQHSDFIQSDGSVPSTSKEVTYIDCPICDEPFLKSEIETHAATCGDFQAMNNFSERSDDENDVMIVGSHTSHEERSRRAPVSCHSDNFVECPVCGDMVKRAVVQNHTNMCIENCIA